MFNPLLSEAYSWGGGGYGARPLESENYVIFRHALPWISHQYTLASNKLSLCMQRWGGGGGRITVLRPPNPTWDAVVLFS